MKRKQLDSQKSSQDSGLSNNETYCSAVRELHLCTDAHEEWNYISLILKQLLLMPCSTYSC